MDSRYHRQLLLPEIGVEGQKKISRARILLVGAGGLGSPVALYLAGAGIGTLGIVDDDVVSLTNLHRQVLYGESDMGQLKAVQAQKRLSDLNSEVHIETCPVRLTSDNAVEIVSHYDMVVDGCDNFSTRFILDDACAACGIPYLYGAVCGFEGQCSVFGTAPSFSRYRDLFPDERATLQMPHPGKQVAGPAPAVVGSVLAAQTILLVCGHPSPLSGKLWTIDLRTMQTFTIDI